ncbi:MAG: Gfo/Idh/MocA family oxidoreductase [Kiritimatiellae bacterium]|nr:Gfo/Idh/MocA family oxidoreductase [Kiritimatiellia bacterium]
MADSIRVGFVGTGGIATHKHMPKLKELEGVECVAMCDVAEDRAKEAAAKFGGKVFTDHRKMFDSVDMDAVYVCLPPFAHTDAEIIAAQKGIHLFAEKPVALTMDKALEILAAVEKAGIITAVGYGPRNTAPARQAKAFLEDKTVVMVTMTRFGGVAGGDSHWWRVMAKSGGPLVEQTTHGVDMLLYVLGDVKRVYANYALRVLGDMPNLDVPDAQLVTLEFASGALGFVGVSCALSKGAGGGGTEFILRDMRVSLGRDGVTLTPEGAAELPPLPEVPHVDVQFIDAIRTGDQARVGCSFREGAKTLDVTLAANESAATGQPVVPHFAKG